MKKVNNGDELAKEMGLKPEVLKKTCECFINSSLVYLLTHDI
jgi:hypothetical protein